MYTPKNLKIVPRKILCAILSVLFKILFPILKMVPKDEGFLISVCDSLLTGEKRKADGFTLCLSADRKINFYPIFAEKIV